MTMRYLVGLTTVALLLASCGRDPRPAAPTAGDSPTPRECREVERDLPQWRNFNPPTRAEGDRFVMPIVFSDGTTAELLFPRQLDLASLGVSVLRTSGLVDGRPDSARGVDVRFGVPPDMAKHGERPVACYEGAHGQVEVWESGDKVVPQWMFVPLHSWTAAIGDGNVGNFLTEDERAAWATALAADDHPDGWVVLRPGDDLRLGVEYHGDVSMEMGDLSERALVLWPIQCRANRGEDPDEGELEVSEMGGGQAFASWCDEDGPMEVHVYADAAFIRRVAEGLEIRNVRHAHDPSKYQIVP